MYIAYHLIICSTNSYIKITIIERCENIMPIMFECLISIVHSLVFEAKPIHFQMSLFLFVVRVGMCGLCYPYPRRKFEQASTMMIRASDQAVGRYLLGAGGDQKPSLACLKFQPWPRPSTHSTLTRLK